MQLKKHFIPKGLVPLEQWFDQNDVPSKPSVSPKAEEVEEGDIGTYKEPKYIKIEKVLPKDQTPFFSPSYLLFLTASELPHSHRSN